MPNLIIPIVFLIAFYLPGNFTRKLILKTATLDIVQSIVIDIGLGISVLTILGLVLNYSLGIDYFSVITSYVIFTGFVFLLNQRKRNHQSFKPKIKLQTTISRQLVLFWLLVISAIVVIIGVKYILLSNYVSLPGDDQYFYMVITNAIINQHSLHVNYQQVTLDGVGFPIISSMFLVVFATGNLPFYTTVPLVFVALTSFSAYVFIRDAIGPVEGILSAILYGAVALPTYDTLGDGTYTIFLAEFFLILGYYFLVRTFKQRSFSNAAVAGLLLMQVLIFNAIVSIIMVSTLPIFLFGFLITDSIRNRKLTVSYLKLKLVLIVFVIIVSTAILLVLFSFLDQYAHSILSVVLGKSGISSSIGAPSVPLSLGEYPSYLGYAFTMLTALGVIAAVLSLVGRASSLEKWPVLVILIWAVVCFGLSITSLSVSPDRFTRELDVPLSLSGAYLFYYLRRMIIF